MNKKNNILYMLFIAVITICAILYGCTYNDYWWHIKAGEYMVCNKSIPFIDVFSWIGVENGLRWFSHEWLSEIILYGFSLIGNYGGLIFICLFGTGLMELLFIFNRNKIKEHPYFAIMWYLLGTNFMMTIAAARPHMISFILLAITIYLLFDYRTNEKSNKIWVLPIVSILWVNLHGGSSNLPYILSIIFIITGLFNFEIGKIIFSKLSRTQLKKYFIITLLCIAVLIINPHGIDMIMYPYTNMNDIIMLNMIAEWRCLDFKKIGDLVMALPLIITIITLICTDENIDFCDLSLIGAFSYLSFKSIRFNALFFIVATFIIFKYIKFELPSKINNIKLKVLRDNTNIFLSKLLIILIIMFSFFGLLNIYDGTITRTINSEKISGNIIDKIKEDNPSRIFNDYNLGGYLIYSGIKPFIDGRADLYTGEILKDYSNLYYNHKTEILDKYNFDYFIIYKDTLIDRILIENSNKYKKVYEEDNIILYERSM